jgi:hypothetical protein
MACHRKSRWRLPQKSLIERKLLNQADYFGGGIVIRYLKANLALF